MDLTQTLAYFSVSSTNFELFLVWSKQNSGMLLRYNL